MPPVPRVATLASEEVPLLRLVLSLVLLSASPARGLGVCVSRSGGATDVDLASLRDALALEARKAGIDLELTEADPCPPGHVAVVVGAGVAVRDGAGLRVLDLAGVAPIDRAQEVARALVELAQAPSGALLDPGAPLVLPRTTPAAAPVALLVVEGGLGWRATLGPSGHVGAVEALVGAALLGERLLVGVEGAWEWPVTSGDDVVTTVTSGEVLALIRGGAPVGPIFLRGGLAGGAQWRTLGASNPERRGEASSASTVGVLAAELELAVPVGPLRLGLLASGRVYLGGESYRWLGRAVWAAPDGALGLGARVGAAF